MAGKARGYTTVAVPRAGGGYTSFVYTKEHKESGGGGKGRTLFVVNVDDAGGTLPDASLEARVRAIWGAFGAVESVELGENGGHRKRRSAQQEMEQEDGSDSDGGDAGVSSQLRPDRGPVGRRARFARVRFVSPQSLKAALQAKELSPWDATEAEAAAAGPRLSGLAAVVHAYRSARQDPAELREQVDSFIADFDAREAEEEQARLAAKNQPDEDGFVTVTYKKRRREATESEGTVAAAAAAAKKKKKKPMELTNFYRFQQREAKREQLATLRDKFEADKAKIARMKAARQFKPF